MTVPEIYLRLWILRLRCQRCRATFGVLPEVAFPRRQMTAPVLWTFLVARMLDGLTLLESLAVALGRQVAWHSQGQGWMAWFEGWQVRFREALHLQAGARRVKVLADCRTAADLVRVVGRDGATFVGALAAWRRLLSGRGSPALDCPVLGGLPAIQG